MSDSPHFTIERGVAVDNRDGYLGGSDASVISGHSPYTTRMQLFAAKKGHGVRVDRDKEELFWFGHAMEPLIAERARQVYGLKTIRTEDDLLFRSTAHSFMAAHLDFIVVNDDGEMETFLECKNIRHRSDEWGDTVWPAELGRDPDWAGAVMQSDASSRIPPYYFAQCLHYMIVLGVRHCYLAALFGGCELALYRVNYDDDAAQQLIRAEHEFWDDLLDNEPPLPVTDDDYIVRFKITDPVPERQVWVPDEQQLAILRHTLEARRLRDEHAAEYEKGRKAVFAAAGGYPVDIEDHGGKVIARIVPFVHVSTDWSRLSEEEPAAFETVKRFQKRSHSPALVVPRNGKKSRKAKHGEKDDD